LAERWAPTQPRAVSRTDAAPLGRCRTRARRRAGHASVAGADRRGRAAAAAPAACRAGSPRAPARTAGAYARVWTGPPRRGARRTDAARDPPRPPPRQALIPDAAPAWTLDQLAGLVFAGGMLASFALAGRVDAALARGQRREIGLCEACGGVNEAATCGERNCPLRDKAGDEGGRG